MSIPVTTTEPISAPAPATLTPRGSPSWRLIMVGVSVIAVAIAAVVFVPRLLKHQNSPAVAASDAQAKSSASPSFNPKTTVLLPDGKMKVAGIELGPVRRDELATEVGVPGQISLNPDRRVEIKPRVAGVVRTVAATIGRKVKAGEVLVTLDSADVGSARLNLRARQRELVTARIEAEWKRDVNTNVAALIPLLRKSTPTRQLEELFRDKLLGTFRGDLLGTYSDFEIASHEEEKQADLFKNNLVGEHLVFLTKHAREAKQAKFEASLEQVRFDASQQARIADQQVRAAEAAVIDAAQRLRILGVSEDITKVLTPAQTAANQSRVGLLTSMGRPTLQVTAAAYPGRTFDARVIYVGEEVDPATRTVSLLAEMPNADGRLRPGMFVQIKLDSPEKTSALTVPAGAVVEIEGVYGVFRPGKDANMFTFAPIVAGAEANGRRTIVSGVAGGDSVVVTGAFTLKSELVLQNESEAE
jgi:cobalt-zinc-cadmium efflux system membrane fusion protein